jgi:putative addiction module CopG family antidote
MNITLRPELQRRIETKVHNGEYESAQALVEEALQWYLSTEEDEGQIEEIKAAVREGLEQAERGEGASLEEFDQYMRRKHGIPR